MVLQGPNYRFPNAAFSGLCVHGTKSNHADPTRVAPVSLPQNQHNSDATVCYYQNKHESIVWHVDKSVQNSVT